MPQSCFESGPRIPQKDPTENIVEPVISTS